MTFSKPKTVKRKAWIILGLLILGTTVSASAFADTDVDNRLNRLENEIQTLNRAVYRGERAPPPSFSGDAKAQAGAEVRVQQLEREVQSLRGTIEEQNHEIRQLSSKLEKALNDMQLRLSDLEKAPAKTADTTYPTPSKEMSNENVQAFTWQSNTEVLDKPKTPMTSDQAAVQYETAFAHLKNAQYDQAQKGFDSFIGSFPKHALVGNAKYWLGETYYVRGNYEKAARIFAEGYKQFPKGSKAPDNLLKLGMALAGTGNTNDACVAFAQLKSDFPSGAVPVLRRADQEMSRLKCSS